MGLTYHALSDRLRDRGIAEQDAVELADLLRRCDESRFAPALPASGIEGGPLLRRAYAVLDRLASTDA